MTDSQNCMELCGDVVDAYREDGLRLERALAMLHKLTTPGHTEPYLGDELPVPAAIFGHGKPLVVQHVEDFQKKWAQKMAEPLEDEPPARLCPICDGVLERRPRESFAEFARRETDSKSCAGQLRSRKNRAAKEAVAG